MLKMVGSSGQLSLGRVPAKEARAHEPAMRNQLRRAEQWAKRTAPAETDLARLLKKVASASDRKRR